MPNSKIFTYQARISLSEGHNDFMLAIAKLLSEVERNLFADYNRGLNILKLKSAYLIKYGITARQFNAIRISVQAKVASQEALRVDYIKDVKASIGKLVKTIKYLSKLKYRSHKQANSLHQKQRRLVAQKNKLQKLELDKINKKIRICFGSKKLFKQQYNLTEYGYTTHEEWLSTWRIMRNNQFLLIGSKDETMGNQSCVALINEDNLLDLKLRVPNALISQYGKFITISNISLGYGRQEVLAAISSNILRSKLSKKGIRDNYGDSYKNCGQAINYRFVKDAKGWRIFITVDKVIQQHYSSKANGAIGVDINIDHLAVTEVNTTGNLINSYKVALCTYGKSKERSKAIIGDAVKVIAEHAKRVKKPIVLEELDFSRKKRDIAQKSAKEARMLSSFAYSTILSMLKSKAFRNCIETITVNPAYSSIIGRVKFASMYNISVHQAAALVIARRVYGFSERLPRYLNKIPDNHGYHVTLPRLVKIAGRHVWHTWAKVMKSLQMELAARYQRYRQTGVPSIVQAGDELDTIPF